MAAFTELDWGRFDVHVIVGNAGIATIYEPHHSLCRAWLEQHGYQIMTLDCRQGIGQAVSDIGRMLNWESQFGYTLTPENRNLDALRDGFEFNIPEEGGLALEILGADVALQEDPRWLLGLLSIAQEYSRYQLAIGRRFFALLVLPEKSPLIGTPFDTSRVPGPYWPRSQRQE